MSQFRDRDSKSPTRQPPSTGRARSRTESYTQAGSQDTGKSSSGKEPFPTSSFQMPSHQESPSSEVRASTQPTRTRERASSRPISMAQTFQPPLMDVNQDTLPELQPIFTFLNSHSNKLYQEGYFLKLDDQNIRAYHILHWWNITHLTLCRWQGQCRSDLDRMFCTACGNYSFIVGCSRVRCCWTGWRGPSKVYQSHRCLDQNGYFYSSQNWYDSTY